MYRYIALLRGINVGGHKKLPMAELRTLFESLGFVDVQSYIQSGNVVFSSEEKVSGEVISEAIKGEYGWKVPVLIKTPDEINGILDNCPFPKEAKEKSYFMFLFQPPSTENIKTTLSFQYPDEEYVITPQCVYFYCSQGYGRAKLSGNLFEQKLKVSVTARNYRTMTKLIELAS
ncbi:MAG: DUF1697 domain-containing protein [Flavobacteriaceae bacterium]|nr:DUF1697 domain-containing protein [Bacteroidia bacterium]NNF31652.1 DUF1697 domain-containing protein [Flavobacteriaceae bacterium]MBT8276708.1 DUF1697 domain-containing protein [Bacteroidia bacterium]NNJ83156.1 DUF1697 domain-containing protein [Flavobacteriaceae bacterium]NNK55166.1 DUF1697 domain-containing protein [Flavobacteriaceae bacterium]